MKAWHFLLICGFINFGPSHAQLFISKADGSASTPANNTVLPSTCIGSPSSMTCSPVSFLVLTNPDKAQTLTFQPINNTIFNANIAISCVEPPTLFDQHCGIDTLFYSKQIQSDNPSDWGVYPDVTSANCGQPASCDFGTTPVSSPRCACSNKGGSCVCFNTTRITVQPILFQNVSNARICFIATAW